MTRGTLHIGMVPCVAMVRPNSYNGSKSRFRVAIKGDLARSTTSRKSEDEQRF